VKLARGDVSDSHDAVSKDFLAFLTGVVCRLRQVFGIARNHAADFSAGADAGHAAN
jgi:hypothetical protein